MKIKNICVNCGSNTGTRPEFLKVAIEEVLEILTWAQLGFHAKPCGLLNICGYYDSILAFLDNAVNQQFIRQEHRDMLLVDIEPANLVSRFNNYEAPPIDKWIDKI